MTDRDPQALQEDVYVGAKYEQLLEEPLLQRMFDDVDAALLQLMADSDTDEATLHFKRARGLLAKVKKVAYTYIETGHFSAKLLEQQKKRWLSRAQ